MITEIRPASGPAAIQRNLGPITQIPMGEGRNFEIGLVRVAVFHTRSGEVFASQSNCPHRVGPLADGLMGGNTLVCPMHGWKFDLASGKTENGECGLEVYPVTLTTKGEIVITLPGI